MEKFKSATPIRIGLLGFVSAIIIGLIMYVFYKALFSNFMLSAIVGIFSLGLLLFLGIWSGITYRRENNNVVSFAHAFMAVYIVFAFYSVGNISSMLLINKVIDKQYAQKASAILKEKMDERLENANMSEEQRAKIMEGMGPEKFDPPMATMLKNLGYWLIATGIVAAIAAAFIKRSSQDMIVTGDVA